MNSKRRIIIVLSLLAVFLTSCFSHYGEETIEVSQDCTYYSSREVLTDSLEASTPFNGQIVSMDFHFESMSSDSEREYTIGTREEPEDYNFESNNMESFLQFVNEDGKTHIWDNERSPLWSDYEDNKVFLSWLEDMSEIAIPAILKDGFKVTYCGVGKEAPINYYFYIENDDHSLVTISFVFIPADKTALDLVELIDYLVPDSTKVHLSEAEIRRGVCKFGDCYLFGRHKIYYETEEGPYTPISYPLAFFQYKNYLVSMANRLKPETDQWDISFLDVLTITDWTDPEK